MDDREIHVRRGLLLKMKRTLQGSSDAGEQEMQEALLMSFSPKTFPHAVAVEWEYAPPYSQYGRGDLAFASDPRATFLERHQPAKILVIEVKFINNGSGPTARTRRKTARNKVNEQILKSMDEWHNAHPLDQVYGCIYTNELATLGLQQPRKRVEGLLDLEIYLPTFPELTASQSHQPLTAAQEDENETVETPSRQVQVRLELVPKSVWGRNYKPDIHADLWNSLSASEKARAGNKCEACGKSSSPLVLHQHWDLDDDAFLMSFVRFEVLCWSCHDVKHFGWAQMENRAEGALKHLRTVTGWKEEEVKAHINEAGRLWVRRSQATTQWMVDSSAFNAQPTVRLWLSRNPTLSIGRFGSVCCLRSGFYNIHPKPVY